MQADTRTLAPQFIVSGFAKDSSERPAPAEAYAEPEILPKPDLR